MQLMIGIIRLEILNMSLENRYRVNQEIEYKTKQEGTTITIEFEGQTQPDLQVEVPLLYYKGYGAKLEGRSLEVISGSNGAVSFVIPEVVGNGIVVVSYEGTTLQHITLGISIISFIAFILIVGRSKLKKYKSKGAPKGDLFILLLEKGSRKTFLFPYIMFKKWKYKEDCFFRRLVFS